MKLVEEQKIDLGKVFDLTLVLERWHRAIAMDQRATIKTLLPP